MTEQRRRVACATGVCLLLLGVYVLTNSGRVDTIDGEYRYAVARDWLEKGEPTTDDMGFSWEIRNETTGKVYSPYNAGASVTAMPLMVLSRLFPGHGIRRDRFAYALTGAFFGAALGGLIVLAYGLLGVGVATSAVSALVFCLATMWWPSSTTVLDQNQHAVLLFASVLLGWVSGRRQSLSFAALAGLVGGLLFTFQENYGLLLPVMALSVFAAPAEGAPGGGVTLRRGVERAALLRYAAFGACCCVGLGLFFAFNFWRFDAPFYPGRFSLFSGSEESSKAHPLAAALSLLASPGKSVFLFSPPLILAFLGMRGLFGRAPILLVTIAATSIAHFLFIIQVPFFSGDWCWGPRYLLVLLPLWALTFPFAFTGSRRRRYTVLALAALGLLVQIIGISLDYHRFFFERGFAIYFWAADEWIYFKHSQLFSRFAEVMVSLRDGIPGAAFQTSPLPDWIYPSFTWYRPWPWPLWIFRVEHGQRPVDPFWLLALCGTLLASGGALIRTAVRAPSPAPVIEPFQVR